MRPDLHTAHPRRAVFWLAALMLAMSQTLCNGPDGIAGAVIAQAGLLLLSIATIASCMAAPWTAFFRGRSPACGVADRHRAAGAAPAGAIAADAVWKSLAGRSVCKMRGIGVASDWRPISLSPVASERCLLALLPAIAIFLAAHDSPTRQEAPAMDRDGAGMLSALLGIAQVNNGPDDLRLYRPSNLSDAVGFFANRNHYGSLLAMLLPFAIGWAMHEFRRRHVAGLAWLVGPCCRAAWPSCCDRHPVVAFACRAVADGPRRRRRGWRCSWRSGADLPDRACSRNLWRPRR